MITIGYSTRKSNSDYQKHIIDTIGVKNVEVIEVVNNGNKSLTEVYNEILSKSSFNVVVLCHDDIIFNTKSWGFKLLKHFEKSDYGILGVAGTTSFPASGMWWEDRSKMIGIVRHENEGKSWVSKYSTSLGNDIEEAIIVDGLFMALNKEKIKQNFDIEFDGFHFYDISFCISNFNSGVKIGVIYNIDITHKSIGVTNNKWEANRIKFCEKFSGSIPIKLPFNRKRKLKVLISLLSFKSLTGSELYVYELVKELINKNCDVSILSNIGDPLHKMVNKLGVNCFDFKNPPGFKMGDGVWSVNTPEGIKKTTPNVYYKISDINYDVIITQHKPVSEMVVNLYPKIPKLQIIHSEIISLEEPIKHESILHHIGIRDSIKEYILSKINVESDSITVLPNPIDINKYNKTNTKNGDYYLFVGTIDYLRIESIKHIIKKAKEENKKVILIGEDKGDYLKSLIGDNTKHINQVWSGLENYVKNCYKVVGIKLGRTTIEGWLCGKNAIIYDVNENGEILGVNEYEPPIDSDKYNSKNVVNNILNKLYEIVNKDTHKKQIE